MDFPTALIFDWDNTLVDSWDAIGEAMNHTRQHFGLPVWSPSEIRMNCTRAARDSFPGWFGSKWEEAYDIYYRGFDAVRKKRSIRMLPGSQDLLVWLRECKIPCFVVSNKRGDYLRIEAEKLGWMPYFVAIVGAQDAPRDKPAREHVDFALGHAALRPDASIWFVGDSETDMICALNSGCTPVFIGTPENAGRLSVPLVFSNCQELQRLLYKRLHNNAQ